MALTTNPLFILKQDKQAHVVFNKETQTLGAALFEAGEYSGAGLILRVNSPSVVMYQLNNDHQIQLFRRIRHAEAIGCQYR